MIININHVNGTKYTIDLRCKQIRRVAPNMGPIDFEDLSTTDIESYEYLYKSNKQAVLECLATDFSLEPEDLSFDEGPVKSLPDCNMPITKRESLKNKIAELTNNGLNSNEIAKAFTKVTKAELIRIIKDYQEAQII